MLKFILLFLIIFVFNFSTSSEETCEVFINTQTSTYQHYDCGFNNFPNCKSIQDGILSLNYLIKNNSCIFATLNLMGGIYSGKENNLVGNYTQLNLSGLQYFQIMGEIDVPTIIDGTGVNTTFFGLSDYNLEIDIIINYLTFKNWKGGFNMFNVQVPVSSNLNHYNLFILNSAFTNIETSSIVVGSANSNLVIEFGNSNFTNIYTTINPIMTLNSNIAFYRSNIFEVDVAMPFFDILNGTLKFNTSSIKIGHPLSGENATIQFFDTPTDKTALCHCENCTFESSNGNAPLEIFDVKCPHKTKEFWIILILSIVGGFAFICFILFLVNKKLGVIDINNKKKRTKLKRSYFDDDEQSSTLLNDSYL
ncbi:hypothetical protein DICPUDRAFT_80275 [Dictyostelium purpureum]|uniref:Transmembrane protein n=1 Tax=Dictyostelium purpureum TaxID=5786 RepID=F0ZQ09_DICPU|nr:uncharacterized protein DICPUDRAFT_80275 [Dictyostelium purpureum]EGC33966.1 hypothetical protein DICPUDRAFT_80275 [Dictyostelium purpureum]|eukprot:XP_003289499.1 hypothetical protein DICPUDRAFT_80275 [Dictyostelium purpureum]